MASFTFEPNDNNSKDENEAALVVAQINTLHQTIIELQTYHLKREDELLGVINELATRLGNIYSENVTLKKQIQRLLDKK